MWTTSAVTMFLLVLLSVSGVSHQVGQSSLSQSASGDGASTDDRLALRLADLEARVSKLEETQSEWAGHPIASLTDEKSIPLNIDSRIKGKLVELDNLVKHGFVSALLSSLLMIIVSELGDKTFFIAAILAMRHPRMVVFAGAAGALFVMTILSAVMGFALPALLPRSLTHYAATCLFFVFGVQLLREAFSHSDDGEDLESEVLEEVDGKGGDGETSKEKDVEVGEDPKGISRYRSWMTTFFSPIFMKAFTLTFLAEWGDRSQIATIAMAAHQNPFGVTVGGFIGHSLCTGLAVIGGRMLATKISEKHVAMVGGCTFLLFGLLAVVYGPDA